MDRIKLYFTDWIKGTFQDGYGAPGYRGRIVFLQQGQKQFYRIEYLF